MSAFIRQLGKKISRSVWNNYGIENYDEFRYGKFLSKNRNPGIFLADGVGKGNLETQGKENSRYGE